MKVYACLLGNWIDITSSGKIFDRDPVIFFKEEIGLTQNDVFKSFEFDYVNVEYEKNMYRIHPSMIQFVK